MRGNLVWDICTFLPSKVGLTKEVVSQKRYYCMYIAYKISVSITVYTVQWALVYLSMSHLSLMRCVG